MKNQYISPMCHIYEVEPESVYCGSGSEYVTGPTLINDSSPVTPIEDDNGICAEAAAYRTTLWGN